MENQTIIYAAIFLAIVLLAVVLMWKEKKHYKNCVIHFLFETSKTRHDRVWHTKGTTSSKDLFTKIVELRTEVEKEAGESAILANITIIRSQQKK